MRGGWYTSLGGQERCKQEKISTPLGTTAFQFGEPLRMNRISIESCLTGAELVTPLRRSVKLGVVPCKLIYGLNTAMFKSRPELPDLMMGNDARGALTGAPRNGTTV